MKRILFCLVLLTVASSIQAADKYALLVGISRYDHDGMNQPEALKFPEEDAKALGEFLKSGGYEVEVLLGKSATQKAIRDRLAKLNQKGSADGVVLIGLFGHGVEVTVQDDKGKVVHSKSGDEVTEGCFCPFDTGIQLVVNERGNPQSGGDGKPLTEPTPDSLIKLSEVMVRLGVAKAGNRVILADCCRTIPNQARGRSFGASFQFSDLPTKTSILFGCSKGEKAFEHPTWGHGAFTKCLLEELPRISQEGDANTGILAGRLQKKVPQLVMSLSPRNEQNPVAFVTNIVDLQLASISKPSQSNPSTYSEITTSRGFEGTKAGDRKELAQGIYFRWCPAGTFKIGSPKSESDRDDGEDQVSVTLTKGF